MFCIEEKDMSTGTNMDVNMDMDKALAFWIQKIERGSRVGTGRDDFNANERGGEGRDVLYQYSGRSKHHIRKHNVTTCNK